MGDSKTFVESGHESMFQLKLCCSDQVQRWVVACLDTRPRAVLRPSGTEVVMILQHCEKGGGRRQNPRSSPPRQPKSPLRNIEAETFNVSQQIILLFPTRHSI